LNTGAGKTVIGNLIAQSLVNEGLQHVVYACGTSTLLSRRTRKHTAWAWSPRPEPTDPSLITGLRPGAHSVSPLIRPFTTHSARSRRRCSQKP
jgi:hypothetical protein